MMFNKTQQNRQRNFFDPMLRYIIDPAHELVFFADQMDWTYFENDFSSFYADKEKASVPIRMMVGALLLEHLYKIDNEVLVRRWVENPYMQYFCGMEIFAYEFPFDPSDFDHFRKQVVEEWMRKISAYSIKMRGCLSGKDRMLSDS